MRRIVCSLLGLAGCLPLAAGRGLAQEPPPFPEVGTEYHFTVAATDHEDRENRFSSPPFLGGQGEILIVRWLGGTWYEVALRDSNAGNAGFIEITNLNIRHLLTLTKVPESSAGIATEWQKQKDALAEENAVTVVGQVQNPGKVAIPPGQDSIDLVEAIQAVGDFKPIARRKQVRIHRLVEGVIKVITVNVRELDASKSGSGEPVRLKPGDLVFVPIRVFD